MPGCCLWVSTLLVMRMWRWAPPRVEGKREEGALEDNGSETCAVGKKRGCRQDEDGMYVFFFRIMLL